MPAKPQKIHKKYAPINEDVVILWKKKGSFIEQRRAFRRVPGDEDICSAGMAKRLQVVGLVEILGPKSEVMKNRTISLGSVVDF